MNLFNNSYDQRNMKTRNKLSIKIAIRKLALRLHSLQISLTYTVIKERWLAALIKDKKINQRYAEKAKENIVLDVDPTCCEVSWKEFRLTASLDVPIHQVSRLDSLLSRSI